MNNQQNIKRPEETPVIQKPATDGEVAAIEKTMDAKPMPNLYTGNVAYVKSEVKGDPTKAYVLVAVRFCNDTEQPMQFIQTFPTKGSDFNIEQGDLVAFEAKRVREALDKDDKPVLMDGIPVFKASGIGQDFRLKLLRKAGKAVAAKPIGAIKSESLKSKLAAISPLVAKLLGITPENQA